MSGLGTEKVGQGNSIESQITNAREVPGHVRLSLSQKRGGGDIGKKVRKEGECRLERRETGLNWTRTRIWSEIVDACWVASGSR